MKKERDELRDVLNIREEQLGTGTQQYDSEDGTRPSRVKTTTVTRVHGLLRVIEEEGSTISGTRYC